MGLAALARTVPGTQSFTPLLGTFWNGCVNGSRMEWNLRSHYILEVYWNALNHSGLPVQTRHKKFPELWYYEKIA